MKFAVEKTSFLRITFNWGEIIKLNFNYKIKNAGLGHLRVKYYNVTKNVHVKIQNQYFFGKKLMLYVSKLHEHFQVR